MICFNFPGRKWRLGQHTNFFIKKKTQQQEYKIEEFNFTPHQIVNRLYFGFDQEGLVGSGCPGEGDLLQEIKTAL